MFPIISWLACQILGIVSLWKKKNFGQEYLLLLGDDIYNQIA